MTGLQSGATREEETFVVLAGTLTTYLGEPPEPHVVPDAELLPPAV